MSITVSCPTCGGSLAPSDQYCPRCGSVNSGAGAFAATFLGTVSPWDEVMVRLREATAGEFQVLGELGRGGMAAVFLAQDLALNRKVAVKVMSPGLLMGPGMMERFKQEAVVVANLSHPHIVTIHGVRQAAGLHYFVMKLVPGASVERLIREVRPLPIPVIQALAHQVGSALAYAHRRGVIHRDVKPSNILLDEEGNAVVTDFGIAKVVESPSHTQTGTTVGTPAYMSPEQCWSREVTAASDQYSLGIVLYEMLTGTPPFSGPTLGILRAHTEDPPGPIREARPECPSDVAKAVHRMLEKDPTHRWPSVLRAVEALGGHQMRDDDPVRGELVRLSQLGPDHPLPLVPTPKSPIPLRQQPPPVAEESIQVRMRSPAPPGAAPEAWTPGPAMAPPPVPPAPPPEPWKLRLPSLPAWRLPRLPGVQLPRFDPSRLPRYWWTAPGVLALLLLVWLAWPSPAPPPRPNGGGADTRGQGGPVVIPVARVELDGAPERVLVGDQFLLAVTARGPRGDALPGREVAWSSSRPDVAEVSGAGEVTALSVGQATITARVETESASVGVTVRAPRAATATVAPGTVRLKVGDSTRVRVRLRDERGESVEGVVIWEAADPSVATISDDGVVVARRPGTTRVVAIADGIQGAGTVVVTPRETPPPSQGIAILRMLISPWAYVTVDGQNRGQRVRGEDTLRAGVSHRLRFSRDGYMTVDTTLTLRPGEQRLLRILMRRRTP